MKYQTPCKNSEPEPQNGFGKKRFPAAFFFIFNCLYFYLWILFQIGSAIRMNEISDRVTGNDII